MQTLGAWPLAAVLWLAVPPGTSAAPPSLGDAGLCQVAIAAAERGAALPPQLLSAIAMVESGRPIGGGRVAAWPWTLNVAGTGYFLASAAEAITAIEKHRAAGIQSIDVGCMQVNLQYHPAAFGSLQDALDPAKNVAYAASFLQQLHAETRSWPQAAAAYHSRTPERATAYGRRVMRAWPVAAAYGGTTAFDTSTGPDRVQTFDPYGVYTPEFARRLEADNAARAVRGNNVVANRLMQPHGSLAQRFPSQLRTAAVGRVAQRLAEAGSAATNARTTAR